MKAPFISICVPAYKRPDYMERLLNSVKIQRFKDYEVVVTDNSPDDSVEIVCRQFAEVLPLQYFRNNPSLDISPNWNEAVAKSGGEWIKIMHSDDWFAHENSLEQFAIKAQQHPKSFIFSAFLNCNEDTGTQNPVLLSGFNEGLLHRSPYHLLRRNYIGPPSTNLIHRSIWQPYNPVLKWIADFEGYIRMLLSTGGNFLYLNTPLVCIGLHDEQTTSDCALNPQVEVPENTILFNTFARDLFQNFFAFDYFWRLIRNLDIQSVKQYQSYIPGRPVPQSIARLIRQTNKIPKGLRAIGAVSKVFAFLFWIAQYVSKPVVPHESASCSQKSKL